ncbi:MAG: hypothetical protein OEM67_01585 [Thermoleophilia bacterium]|nr:hypothetical protein [Thermoleophilia bacterium]MDH3725475.1 hypothetical protein [Thermoleophilia bacterium]
MKVDTALLCDAVSIREGLLHILGGGITRIWVEQFPAAINATLALRVLIGSDEAESPQGINLLVQGPDGEELGSFNLDFGVNAPEGADAAGEVPIPLAIPMQQVQLPAPGSYSIEVKVGDTIARSVRLEAAHRPQQQAG